MKQKVMLIDGNSLVNRAYYGVPLLSNGKGQYTNAIHGFFHIVLKLLEEDKPDYLAVAFDRKAPTFRHQTFEGYKGTRKGMPEELASQMPLLKELLTAMGVKQFAMDGYEADDILGTLSKQAEEAGYDVVVVSGDRDLLQLASETLKVRIPKTKGGKTEVEDYYASDVQAAYGVTPTEFIDMKALMGDASDNIPGVPGIGEKTAAKIIQTYHSVEEAIAHAAEVKPAKASKNLQEFAEQARLSKYLATIVRDMPITFVPEEMPSLPSQVSKEAYELMKSLELKALLSRFSSEEGKADQAPEGRILTDKGEAEAFLADLMAEKTCAYVLFQEAGSPVGFSLYGPKSGSAFLPLEGETSFAALEGTLRPFLEEESIQKIGHGIKADQAVLRPFGIQLGGAYFDTAIAAYLLNPLRDTYAYDDIASEWLKESFPSEEEVQGKGKSRKALLSLSQKEWEQFALPQAQVLWRGKEVMAQKLEENGQTKLFTEVEMPLLWVLSDMEKWGMKVDKAGLIAYGKELEGALNTLTEEIYRLAGEEFNINSPKQLGVILFEKLQLPGGKKTKTGYSTAADVLEKLKNDSPLVEQILLYRQLSKLKSTYADGLLNVMDEKTEKIYSTFHQTVTATGRISSTEPNLQNIPIRLELGRQLRKVFIPTDENYVFLDADYSQIELRLLAHMAQDETLIRAFREGQDIHRLTASQVFHVPFDEVTDRQRSNAKAVNFGIVYGIGAFSLSQDLDIPRKEAEHYIESYFKQYPNIKGYLDRAIEDGRKNGYVSTLFGRRRPMPELASSNFVQRSFGERVAMNMPIQGSAADIIKIAMVKVHRHLTEGGFRSRLILQVHDELLIEAHVDEIEAVSALLKEDMEQAVSLSVPMVAEVKMGRTWYETK